MSIPLISVIGALSIDTITIVDELPEAGMMCYGDKFVEVGGRAAVITIAAHRACHPRPSTDDGLLPDSPHEGPNGVSEYFNFPTNMPSGSYSDAQANLRVIAAVEHARLSQFKSLFRRNGVSRMGLTAFKGSQSEVTSIVQRDKRRARGIAFGGVEQQWEPSHFDTAQKLGKGRVPDLVIVTMEPKKEVVEQIIRTAYGAGIDVIVYGSPATSLLNELYPMITHIVLDEGDATVILGEDRGFMGIDTWHETCEHFQQDLGVQNVVLKLGPYGAYYRSDAEEGYRSAYTRMEEVADTTGSTAAFVGAYAIDYLRQKAAGTWNIEQAVEVGNKVCAFCVVDIGCVNALPWATDLDSFDSEPLFRDLVRLRVELEKRKAAARGN